MRSSGAVVRPALACAAERHTEPNHGVTTTLSFTVAELLKRGQTAPGAACDRYGEWHVKHRKSVLAARQHHQMLHHSVLLLPASSSTTQGPFGSTATASGAAGRLRYQVACEDRFLLNAQQHRVLRSCGIFAQLLKRVLDSPGPVKCLVAQHEHQVLHENDANAMNPRGGPQRQVPDIEIVYLGVALEACKPAQTA